ncbi:MAG: hypothetical protein M1817_002599 [Caeruleum heppii]|nr:MAG: hypothetical protein M1817_002599 [Caeruleum heppii]
MGDPSDEKNASIPSWQKSDPSDAAPTSSESVSSPPSDNTSPSPTRPQLLELAATFLRDDGIRTATRDRQAAFLEAKGLSQDEVEKLLEVSEGDSAGSHPVSSTDGETTQQMESTASSNPHSNAPPIITYPEFLTPAPRPAPLITARRVLNTVYFGSAIAATMYGASKYLIEPMSSSLTEARHDFAQTVIVRLGKLNGKLEGAVSEIPKSLDAPKRGASLDGNSADTISLSSNDDDPAELFHVDIGTQTSPLLSRRASTSSTSSSSHPTTPDKHASINAQQSRLQVLHRHMADLLEANNDIGDADELNVSSIQDLKSYLDELVYNRPLIFDGHAYGAALGRTGDGKGGATAAKTDEIAKVKTEIRGIKGVLLSARNFPGGGRRV